MNGEALHTCTPRQARGRFASPLDLFAAVLLSRWEPDDELTALVARVRSQADAAVSSGRATAGDEDLHYRLLYDAARATASTVVPSKDPPSGATRWERAASALDTLRHRQRAVLTLYYLLGRPLSGVATTVGVREPQARAIVEAGVSALLRALNEPIDVRRALRAAGARLLAPSDHRQDTPVPEPAKMPRAVMRTLLGPAISEPIPPLKVIADLPELPAELPMEPPAERPGSAVVELRPARSRFRAGAAMIAAVAGLLMASVFIPASADDALTPAPPVRQAEAVTIAAPAPASQTVALPSYAVRPGDTLWAIAERHLGDGRRWTEVWEANRRARMRDGRTFRDPDLIEPGWRLRLPRR